MKRLEQRVFEILDKNNGIVDKFKKDIAVDYETIALDFAKYLHTEGYIYAGEGDYMYPDANGLVSGEYLFNQFIENYYS